MTLPGPDPAQVAPDLIGIGAQSIVDNAKRLGLTWTLTLATVTSVDPIEAIVDGDTVTIGMTSMIGSVSLGQRVYVIQVPPSGNFIAGSVLGSVYRDTFEFTTTSASSCSFTIPSAISVIQIMYTARFEAGGADNLRMRVNNDTTAGAHRTTGFNNSTAAYVTPFTVAETSWIAGLVTGLNNPGTFSGGVITINNWNATHTSSGFLNWTASSNVYNVGIFAAQRVCGGNTAVLGPYTSLQFFTESTFNFTSGTRFELIGFSGPV